MRLRATPASLPAVLLAAVVLATGCSTPGEVPKTDQLPQAGQQQNGGDPSVTVSKEPQRSADKPRTIATGSVKGGITIVVPEVLKGAVTAGAKAFEGKNAGTSVKVVALPSEAITADLLSGKVAADVVITGSSSDMGVLFGKNRVGEPAPVARSGLVVVVPSKNKAKISSVADLKGKSVALCAANTGCGVSGAALLDGAKVQPGKATRAANAAGVLSLVAAGRVDAGVVGVVDAEGASKIKKIDVPATLKSVTLDFYIAPMLATKNGGTASELVVFLAHDPAAATALQQAGFTAN